MNANEAMRTYAVVLHAVELPSCLPIHFCNSARIACATRHLNWTIWKRNHSSIYMVPLCGLIFKEYRTKVRVKFNSQPLRLHGLRALKANLY